MKIKHFVGYGCVNATKVKDNTCKLHVKVTGNHEYGLGDDHTWDDYLMYNWLVKRFDKKLKFEDLPYRRFNRISTNTGYENNTETCDFCFWY